MYKMRESWTDARLDDFAAHTSRRFDALERRIESGFARVDTRLDAMLHVMMGIGGGVIVALIGLIATQL
jgi:hypothetical protein